MTVRSLLNGLHDVLVDPEGDGAGEGEEAEVGYHADEGEDGEGEQCHHDDGEHRPRLDVVPPVDQRLHCQQTIQQC